MSLENSKVLDVFSEKVDYQKFVSDNRKKLGARTPLVVVLNDYMPAYRLPLFTLIERQLESNSIKFRVVTGNPDNKSLLRRDMTTAPFHEAVRKFSLNLGSVSIRYLFARKITKKADAVVCEYSVTNLNTWVHILFSKQKKVFLWGHGPDYLAKPSWFRTTLELFLAKGATKILFYTKPGMERAIQLGVDRRKTDYLNNTFDWEPITQSMENLNETVVTNFIREYNLTSGKTLCFIGALDDTKRISFLADVMNLVWIRDREVKFLFAGEGTEKFKLDKAVDRGQAVLLGRIVNSEKGVLSKVSSSILMPGNIGLVAVDALALGIPIIGTNVRSSPEKDYLVEGESLHTFYNSAERFADELLEFLRTAKQKTTCGLPPKIQDFASVFATNLIQQVQPEKPRILFLTNLPAPYRMSLFNALSKDFEVTVGFTGGADGGRQWQLPERSQLKFNVLDSGRLIGLGKLKFPFPRKGIRRHIRESNLVVVGGWSSLVYIYGLLLAKRLDIRSAVWFESTLQSSLSQSSFLKKFKARIFSLGAFVLTPGESSSEAVTNYSSNEAPVVQISNPVEDVFIPRSANNVSDSGPRGVTKYLYFGRLLSWKCVDQLIHAFSNLPDDNVSLTIIGTGPELMKLKQLAHLSNKSDRIEFREMVPYTEALSIYSKYDVLVLPSNREVWGLVVPEALLTGLTVVAADSVGCVKSFKEVERLLLFETNSVESLTMTMHAATQRINLSEASYERLRVLNSSVSFAAAFKQFYSGAYSSRLLETNRKLEINKP